MVLISDGSSEHGAYIWSRSDIFLRPLVTSKETSNQGFYFIRTQHGLSYHLIYWCFQTPVTPGVEEVTVPVSPEITKEYHQ